MKLLKRGHKVRWLEGNNLGFQRWGSCGQALGGGTGAMAGFL